MPFNLSQDVPKIMLALRIPQTESEEGIMLQKLLEIQGRSEALVQDILVRLQRFEEAKEELHKASTSEAGLLKVGGGVAGELTYASNRSCITKAYIEELRSELELAIGQNYNYSFPF